MFNSNGIIAQRPQRSILEEINDLTNKQQGPEVSIEDDYEPPPGTVVYCELGPVEHSGIYVGSGKIVHLNRFGEIKSVEPKTFTDSIATMDEIILVPYDGNAEFSDESWKYSGAVGNKYIANNAMAMIGRKREYNFILDNCHQFCAGCITEDYDNAVNFLWMLKALLQKEINLGDPILWFVWNWRKKTLTRKRIPDHKTTVEKIAELVAQSIPTRQY